MFWNRYSNGNIIRRIRKMNIIDNLTPKAKVHYFTSRIRQMREDGKLTEKEKKYIDAIPQNIKSNLKKDYPLYETETFWNKETDDDCDNALIAGLLCPISSPFVAFSRGVVTIVNAVKNMRARNVSYNNRYAEKLENFIDRKQSSRSGTDTVPADSSTFAEQIAGYESTIDKLKEKGVFSKENETIVESIKKDAEVRGAENSKFSLTREEKLYLYIPWFASMTAIAVGVRAIFHALHKKENYKGEFEKAYAANLAAYVPTIESSKKCK